ncbi:MAG: purine-nucleoside phosphorylase [Bacillota bacterium]
MLENENKLLIETVDFILNKIEKIPDALMILGSGLGNFAEKIENPVVLKYKDIPNFPVSTVQGHAGQLVIGSAGGKYVAAMQGRFHYYEGYNLDKITFPVKVFAKMGTEILIATNAAGIVNEKFKPTDLMVLTDHINLMFSNPLLGKNNETLGPRFPDMTEVYTKELRELALKTAEKHNIPLRQGIYAAMSGPSYETPAEIRMVRFLGGDAVGMSTVPEAIVAHYCGMKCLGISCLTNYGAGITDQKLNHKEVLLNSQTANDYFCDLLYNVIAEM